VHYSFIGKIDLLPGVTERLFDKHGRQFDLFRDNFVASPAPRLALERFQHLQPQLGYLVALLRDALESGRPGVNVLIYGPPGTGKTELTRTLAATIGTALYEVALARDEGRRINGAQRLAAYVLSQRILAAQRNRIVLFDELEDIDDTISDEDEDFVVVRSRPRGSKGWFNQLLETNAAPAIWVSNRVRHIDPAHLRRFDFHLRIGVPPVGVRRQILEEHTQALGVSSRWAERVVQHESIGPALIERTARVASAVLRHEPQAKPEAVMDSLLGSSLKVMGLDQLPRAGDSTQLQYDPALACTTVDVPGLVASLRNSPHARMCFYGVPGTGKSALAVHLAEALGRPVILKRCSDLLGTYVGESERFVAAAFEAAREQEAVLIMDEVDSFLISRQSAQRHHEVTLVNEFLQQMEAFDRGIFVATTNLMDRLDEATLRRFDLKVCFEYLRPAQAVELMRRACTALGVHESGCEELVRGLHKLAPGDFALVMRQARFRPVRDAADIHRRLVDEVVRKGGGRPIGFSAAA
jgi:SpoVK/Ycf46/Vps4 family AAA+-type ATPase